METEKQLELPAVHPTSAPKAPAQSSQGPKRSRPTMVSADSIHRGRNNLNAAQARTAVGRLSVSGCSEQRIAEGVHGVFECCGTNHGRPAYKNVENRSFTAFIYYWDDRAGPEFQGWWIGPKLGGEDVWVRQPSNADLPPESGWYAPHDGSIDPGLQVRPVDVADHSELEKKRIFDSGVPDAMEAAAIMDEEQHSQQVGQDDAHGDKSEFDALQVELEETRQQSDEQVRQLLMLQQQMEERRQKEEILLRRMREMVVPLASTRTMASCLDALPPPPE